MKLNAELLQAVGDFSNKIKTKDYSYLDFDVDTEEFVELRVKVMNEYPGEFMFNKPIYHTSDFNKSYEEMRIACGEMISLIMEKGL
jgi:hypothetical protein